MTWMPGMTPATKLSESGTLTSIKAISLTWDDKGDLREFSDRQNIIFPLDGNFDFARLTALD
jgi:hypothetical protein